MCLYCHTIKNEKELDVFNAVISSEDLWHFNLNVGNNSLKSSHEKLYLQLQSRLGLIQFGLQSRQNYTEVEFKNDSVRWAQIGRTD